MCVCANLLLLSEVGVHKSNLLSFISQSINQSLITIFMSPIACRAW